jgi:hypothetical protein
MSWIDAEKSLRQPAEVTADYQAQYAVIAVRDADLRDLARWCRSAVDNAMLHAPSCTTIHAQKKNPPTLFW